MIGRVPRTGGRLPAERSGPAGPGDGARPPIARHRAAQPFTTDPPFGCSTCPVMYDESSEARKTYDGATSSGCPGRWSGTSAPNDATFSSSNVEGISGVQIGPGATALTRMPFSASPCDSDRVNATMAPLVDE